MVINILLISKMIGVFIHIWFFIYFKPFFCPFGECRIFVNKSLTCLFCNGFFYLPFFSSLTGILFADPTVKAFTDWFAMEVMSNRNFDFVQFSVIWFFFLGSAHNIISYKNSRSQPGAAYFILRLCKYFLAEMELSIASRSSSPTGASLS